MDLVKKIKESVSDDKNVEELKIKKDKPEDKPKFASRVKNIKIKYDFDGKEKQTTAQSKIMDYQGRINYERVITSLQEGMPADSLSQDIKNRHMCVARIAIQIIDPPQWVLEAAGEDLEFCFTLARRLLDHEAEYFRYSGSEDSSTASRPRFSID
jgi:hypothetical protein